MGEARVLTTVENRGPCAALARCRLLLWLLLLASALLLSVTFRLWTPQTLFPRVPLIRILVGAPAWGEWSLLAITAGALGVAAVGSYRHTPWQPALCVFALALGGLVLFDQHRAQPWVWQFLLTALVLVRCPQRRAVLALKLLTLGIYFHSAIAKLDFSFCNSLGPLFLQTMFSPFGVATAQWPVATQRLVALLFPLGELATVAALAMPRWNRAGVAATFVMHTVMIAILGPWGLQQRPGVLIWNLFCMVEAVVLFWPEPVSAHPADEPHEVRTSKGAGVQALIVVAVFAPFLEPWGLIDVWPAWGLYAAHGERATILLHESARSRLPADVLRQLDGTTASPPWLRLRYDRWSLETVAAPVYPQNRFALGVALAVARQNDLERFQIRIQLDSAANRWTGRRSSRTLTGEQAIADEAGRFWLNAIPDQAVP